MRQTYTEMMRDMAQRIDELEKRLQTLLTQISAKAVFIGFAHRLLVSMNNNPVCGDEQTAYTSIEWAAWRLFPEFGKCENRDQKLIDETIETLLEYNEGLRYSRLLSVPDKDSNESLSQHMLAYSANVRGTAYPHQIERRIKSVMSPFDVELNQLTGTTPTQACVLVQALGKQLLNNLNAMFHAFNTAKQRGDQINRNHGRLTDSDKNELARIMNEMAVLVDGISAGAWLPSRDQTLAVASDLTPEDWDAFRQTIGFTQATRTVLAKAEEVQHHPVFFPDDAHAVYLHAGQCYDAIFTYFDDVLRSTPGLQDRYGKQVADWMEAETAALLSRLFPAASLLRNATFPDPDNPGGETEADTVVFWGPFLSIFESKGKRIHTSAMSGDVSTLRTALRNNIQSAFHQARRVVRILERDGKISFTEKISGRVLVVTADRLQRIYPVSVTLQYFGGIPTQLARTQKIGLFKGNAFPWSVSIDDLEVITRFAGSPDVFLHYIERRIAHQSMETTLIADELNLFGHYLSNRLHPSLYEQSEQLAGFEGGAGVCLEGGEHKFAPFYMAVSAGQEPPDMTSVELSVPPRIRTILAELRNRTDDGARWIAFSLLGLSEKTLAILQSVLIDFDRIPIAPHPILRKTFSDGDIVINVLAHESLQPADFMNLAEARTVAEHYRAKARASITIGIDRRVHDRPFVFAHWYQEGPWREDPVMEKVLKEDENHLRQRQMMANTPIPGRNDPCPCGSGKKFKKCCIGKVERVKPIT